MHTFGQSKVSLTKMLSALFSQGHGFCPKSSHAHHHIHLQDHNPAATLTIGTRNRGTRNANLNLYLIHSADVCLLVMACVGYSRAQQRTLSSLLKSATYYVATLAMAKVPKTR